MKPLRRILIGGLLALLVACGSNPPANGGSDDLEVTEPQPLSADTREQASFLLENTGSSALDWSISVSNDASNPESGDWFIFEPDSGRLSAGETQEVTLTLMSGLAEGEYRATLTVSYTGGQTQFVVEGSVGEASGSGGFTLETDGVTNSVFPGAEVFVPITINRTDGFGGAVTLEVFGAPDGLSGTFDPNPASGNESTLTVMTENEVAAGNYSLSVRGTSGRLSDSAEVEVMVVGTTDEPTFSLALSPANLTALPGDSASSTVTVQKTSSFSSSVALSADAPSGVDVSFNPASTTSSSQLTVSVGNGVEPGSYTITIEGSGGGQQSSTRLGLTVPQPGGGGGDEPGSISGIVYTDAYMENFTVPSDVTGGSALAASAERPQYVEGQVLVKLEPVTVRSTQGRELSEAELRQEAVEAFLGRYDLTLVREAGADEPLLAEVPAGESVPEMVTRLEQDPSVAYAEPNYYIYPLSVPNDPEFDRQWNLAVSGVPVAWEARASASNVTVAVIDSGFDLNHPDLSGIFVNDGYDFCDEVADTNSDGQPDVCSDRDDDVSPDSSTDTHGTHVAGIVAARGGNDRGVAGVLRGGASIVPVKVFYNYSFTTADALAQAIRWAAGDSISGVPGNSNPADIINLSLGTTNDSQTVEDAVNEARSRGALLIAAAGNRGHEGQDVLYPAKYEGVVAVGSVNSNFERSCFSNTGPEIDVMAAGGDGFICNGPDEAVLSTIPNGNYGTLIGTSQAAPLVSGIAALMLSENPDWSASRVEQELENTAYQTDGMNIVRADYAFGFPEAGDQVSVSASGPSSDVDTVTLNVDGGSEPFVLDNLEPGTYEVEADVGNLSASESVSLSSGEDETLNLRLQP